MPPAAAVLLFFAEFLDGYASRQALMYFDVTSRDLLQFIASRLRPQLQPLPASRDSTL